MLNKEIFKDLIRRYLDGSASEAEKELVDRYYKGLLEESRLSGFSLQDNVQEERILARINAAIEKEHTPEKRLVMVSRRRWYAYAAIAACGLVLITLVYFFRHTPVLQELAQQRPAPAVQPHDVPPGGNRAVLTLANGRQIVLDSASNGALSSQGNIQVLKLDSGLVAYHPSGIISPGGEVQYNTLTTPRGGQYCIMLSDGSKVWMNAQSSLRFPASFSGKERRVVLNGQAYFEIAANDRQPFILEAGNISVQVLGTSFDVMAYPDENNIKTTLVTGAVKVKGQHAQHLLKPGQQAVYSDDHALIIKTVDVDQITAWKNDLFLFNSTDLETAMRQLARWYNISPVFEDNLRMVSITGKMPRSYNLSQVLKVLAFTAGLRYKIEGTKVIIYK